MEDRSIPPTGPSPAPAEAARHVGARAAIYGIGHVLLRAMSLILLPVVTRFLAPADYGIVAAALGTTAALSIIFPLGLHGSLTRIHFDTSDETDRRETAWTLWIAILVSAAILAGVLDLWGGPLLARVFRDIPYHPYLRLAVWTAFLGVFALLPQGILQVRERAGTFVLVTACSAGVTLASVLMFVVHLRMGALGYLLGTLAAALAAAIPYAILTWRHSIRRFRRDVFRRALAYGLPLVPHGLAGWVLAMSDRIILERFRPMGELGIYLFAFQLAGAITLAATAANTAWVPFLFKSHARDPEASKPMLARLATWYAAGLAWLCLALVLLARPAVALLGSRDFSGASAVLPWLAGSMFLGAMYFVPANFLFLASRTVWIPIGTILAGAVNVGLNLWLVPSHGFHAAAISSLVGNALLLLLTWVVVRPVFPFPYEYRRLAGLALAGGSLMAVGLVLPDMSASLDFAIRATLTALFPALLWLSGSFSWGELRDLLGRGAREANG